MQNNLQKVKGRPIPSHFEKVRGAEISPKGEQLYFLDVKRGEAYLGLPKELRRLLCDLAPRERALLDRFHRLKGGLYDENEHVDPTLAWGMIGRGLMKQVDKACDCGMHYPWHMIAALTPLGRQLAAATFVTEQDFLNVRVDDACTDVNNGVPQTEQEWLLDQMKEEEKKALMGLVDMPGGLMGPVSIKAKWALLLEAKKLVTTPKGLTLGERVTVRVTLLGRGIAKLLMTERKDLRDLEVIKRTSIRKLKANIERSKA